MPNLVEQIAKFESEYDEEVSFSKFLKRHGGTYTQDDFVKFLRARYKRINRLDHPDNLKPRYRD
jgi:hypothetical protein